MEIKLSMGPNLFYFMVYRSENRIVLHLTVETEPLWWGGESGGEGEEKAIERKRVIYFRIQTRLVLIENEKKINLNVHVSI